MSFVHLIWTTKYKALSAVWEKANQALLNTQVEEDHVPEEKQVAAARAALAADAELFAYEKRYLSHLYALLNRPVTPGDIMGVTHASLYGDTIRQSTLGLAVRGDLNDDEYNAMQKAIKILSKPNDVFNARDRRVNACIEARTVIRDLGI